MENRENDLIIWIMLTLTFGGMPIKINLVLQNT